MKIDSTFSGLDRKNWKRLKLHFRRTSSLRITSDDRRTFRNALESARKVCDSERSEINALPVSTTEWSSSVFKINDEKIALVDVEQANAINFLVSRSFFLERPIFTYIEFMVRASEACATSGDIATAETLSDIANAKLRDYANFNGTSPNIERPGFLHPHLLELIRKNISLAFVTGHEIGHLCQDKDTPTKKWAEELYKKHELEPGKNDNSAKFIRFLKPECVQKFDTKGNYQGDALLQIKFRNKFGIKKRSLINESNADTVGLISATVEALNTQIPPEDLFYFLFVGLEASEMLMTLKRLMPRLPVCGTASSVLHEHTSLGFRRFSLISAIRDIRFGKLPVEKEVREYWKKLPQKKLSALMKMRNQSHVESGSNRSIHISRAALTYAYSGSIPDAPSEQQILKQWGPLAGSGFFLGSFTKIPKSWMEIDLHHLWMPNKKDEVLAVGFATAMKDIAEVFFRRPLETTTKKHLENMDPDKKHIKLNILRHPRTQIFHRRLSPTPRPST